MFKKVLIWPTQAPFINTFLHLCHCSMPAPRVVIGDPELSSALTACFFLEMVNGNSAKLFAHDFIWKRQETGARDYNWPLMKCYLSLSLSFAPLSLFQLWLSLSFSGWYLMLGKKIKTTVAQFPKIVISIISIEKG